MKFDSTYQPSHFDEYFNITEVGMTLSIQERQKIYHFLEELRNKSPAKSLIRLKLEKCGKKIKAKLIIKNYAYNFSAYTEGFDPIKIFKQLEKNIIPQLNQWRKIRFSNQNLDFYQQKALELA